jgi:hypothetical protein
MNNLIVIPAVFKRESSGGGAGLDSGQKHAGMTKSEVSHFVHFILWT